MKKKDEVIQGFLDRHFRLYQADKKLYNEIKSQLANVWANGFATAIKNNAEVFSEGYDAGYVDHDRDWKRKNELIAELKQTEYDRGFNAARCTVEADKNIAYQQGFEAGKKNIDEEEAIDYLHKVMWLQRHDESIGEREYDRGYDDGKKAGLIEGNPAVAYDKGLEDAWDAAEKIIYAGITPESMTYYELKSLFGTDIKTDIFSTCPPDEVVEKIRIYEEEQKAKVTNALTNAQKFAEIFGFKPPMDFTDTHAKNLTPWWDEPYKEPDNEMD